MAGTISRAEFRKAMPAIGLKGSREQFDKLFDFFDEDGSDSLDTDELRKKLRPSKLAKVTQRLKAAVDAGTAPPGASTTPHRQD